MQSIDYISEKSMLPEKIRTSVIFFSIYIWLMLFQTPYLNLGTISAIASISIAILSTFFSGVINLRRVLITKQNILILIFLVLSTFNTFIQGYIPSYFARYFLQVILFIVFSSITLRKKEEEFIELNFVLASSLYALLTIISCIKNSSVRYYHSPIILFNTNIDPNYIGIPFVLSSTLLFYWILNVNKIALNISLLFINIIAIIFTASRGSFLALAVLFALVFWCYLTERRVPLRKKSISFVLLCSLMIIGSSFIFRYLPGQWQRMSDISLSSNNGRFQLWSAALRDFSNAPLFGNGIGYVLNQVGMVTHNTFIQILCETGIVGFTLFFGVFISFISKTRKLKDQFFFFSLVGLLLFFFSLDLIDNRCIWIVLTICSMVSKDKSVEENRLR